MKSHEMSLVCYFFATRLLLSDDLQNELF